MKLDDQLMQLQERSDYARDVLGRVPGWLLRWGSSLIVVVVALLFTGAWVIKYPDVIPAPITLTTESPPLRVVARSSGELNIMIDDAEHPVQVNAGEVVAIIDHPAEWARLASVRNWLDKFYTSHDKKQFGAQHLQAMRQDFSQFGEMQPVLNRFLQQYETYFYTLQSRAGERRMTALLEEQKKRQKLLEQQRVQLKTLKQSLTLAQASLSRLEHLAEKKLVSPSQLDEQQTLYLQVVNQEEQQRALIAETEVSNAQLEKEYLNVQINQEERVEAERVALMGFYSEVISEIQRWEDRYVLRAPISGQVSWSEYWSSHQHVRAGDDVFTVVPGDAQSIVGRLALPMLNSGKAGVGQAVYIKLHGYPYREYGILSGTIAHIASAPKGQHYDIWVELPKGLTTSFGKPLPFIQEMQGQAEIVTEDLRLLQRIYYQLLSAFQ